MGHPWGPSGGGAVAGKVTLVPAEGGAIHVELAGFITICQIEPDASITACTLTADDGVLIGQFLVLSLTGMLAAGKSIGSITISGSNFSAAELALLSPGGYGARMSSVFVWDGAKWLLLFFSE